MGKYLKLFSNHNGYTAYTADTENYLLPNVSYCIEQDEVHFNPYDGPTIIAKYNVTSTASTTKLASSITASTKEMLVDGVKQDSVTNKYKFSTTGEHEVKFILNDNVTNIEYNAFYQCSNLTSITIPNSVTSIGISAFNNCSNLKRINSDVDGVFNIPSSVTSIGNYAFGWCSGLTSIDIPSGVTTIGTQLFGSCGNLSSVTIPNGVISIGNYAFKYCRKISSVTIPSSVTSIGTDAFDDCERLSSVICNPTTPPTLGITPFTTNAPITTIYVPSDSVQTYKEASGWSNYASQIKPIAN